MLRLGGPIYLLMDCCIIELSTLLLITLTAIYQSMDTQPKPRLFILHTSQHGHHLINPSRYTVKHVLEGTFKTTKCGLRRQVTSQKRFNSYEIVYNR
jgi:hypothetical protein